MPFFKSLPAEAGPPAVFTKYPEIYGPWSTMSQALMNGPSPLSQGERELILAYAAAVGGCEFVYVRTPRSPTRGASRTASSSACCKTHRPRRWSRA